MTNKINFDKLISNNKERFLIDLSYQKTYRPIKKKRDTSMSDTTLESAPILTCINISLFITDLIH